MTLRRYFLDKKLSGFPFSGKVLDIGGHRTRRGTFRIPETDVSCWEIVNIDPDTNPDYCCSADDIPVDSCSYDIVVLTEVLEHLNNPEKVIKECHRVLKVGGTILVSMPFLFPVHADPYDYQRWTSDKLFMVMSNNGFKSINISPMGGIVSVFHDLMHVYLVCKEKNFRYFFNKIIRKLLMPVLFKIGCRSENGCYKDQIITTGWFVSASK